MDFLGEGAGDSGHRLDVLQSRRTHRAGTAEVMQQRALAAGADAGDFVQGRAGKLVGAARAMRAYGEAMRLVAQALQEIEHGIARLERERRSAWHEEALASGIAVGTLGNADNGDV